MRRDPRWRGEARGGDSATAQRRRGRMRCRMRGGAALLGVRGGVTRPSAGKHGGTARRAERCGTRNGSGRRDGVARWDGASLLGVHHKKIHAEQMCAIPP